MSGSGHLRGCLVAFEGGEGCGKSTQARLLADALGAVLTVEPGGTALGACLRQLVLDWDGPSICERAEALLLAADRAQHVAEVVAPALAGGAAVVTDRFVGSTLAYQGYGRGLELDQLRLLSTWAAEGIEADLVILLEVPEMVARSRLGLRAEGDRIEGAGAAFHQRVLEGYRALAAADPTRWVTVDGTGTVSEVATRVRAAYDRWASSRSPAPRRVR